MRFPRDPPSNCRRPPGAAVHLEQRSPAATRCKGDLGMVPGDAAVQQLVTQTHLHLVIRRAIER
eukprot:5603914-Lingulodinium_polyedra.AAC.1